MPENETRVIAARSLQLAILSVVAASSAIASADTAAIVVAGDPGKKATVVDAVAPWLEAKGQSVMLDSVPDKDIEKITDCFISDDTGCAQPAVKGAGVGRLVFVMVEVSADDDITMTGWLFAGDGGIRAQQVKTCESCRADRVPQTARDLIEALWRAADPTKATLKITSNPAGAQIKIDDAPSGVTPATIDVEPGSHTVALELDGHDPGKQTVEAKGGTVVPVDVELQRRAIVKTKSRLPWFVIGGGGAAIVLSGVLFAIDQDDPPPGPTRPAEYTDTGVPAAVIGAVGVAAVGVGVYLLLRKHHESAPIAHVTRDGGLVLGWGGQF